MEANQVPHIGELVIYTDPKGKEHNALVTADWNMKELSEDSTLNLVYVTDDETKTDQYGRQIARDATSVTHKSKSSAPGRYWDFAK